MLKFKTKMKQLIKPKIIFIILILFLFFVFQFKTYILAALPPFFDINKITSIFKNEKDKDIIRFPQNLDEGIEPIVLHGGGAQLIGRNVYYDANSSTWRYYKDGSAYGILWGGSEENNNNEWSYMRFLAAPYGTSNEPITFQDAFSITPFGDVKFYKNLIFKNTLLFADSNTLNLVLKKDNTNNNQGGFFVSNNSYNNINTLKINSNRIFINFGYDNIYFSSNILFLDKKIYFNYKNDNSFIFKLDKLAIPIPSHGVFLPTLDVEYNKIGSNLVNNYNKFVAKYFIIHENEITSQNVISSLWGSKERAFCDSDIKDWNCNLEFLTSSNSDRLYDLLIYASSTNNNCKDLITVVDTSTVNINFNDVQSRNCRFYRAEVVYEKSQFLGNIINKGQFNIEGYLKVNNNNNIINVTKSDNSNKRPFKFFDVKGGVLIGNKLIPNGTYKYCFNKSDFDFYILVEDDAVKFQIVCTNNCNNIPIYYKDSFYVRPGTSLNDMLININQTNFRDYGYNRKILAAFGYFNKNNLTLPQAVFIIFDTSMEYKDYGVCSFN